MPDGVVEVGPCKCGGYGQVLDEEAARERGRCHIPLDEVTQQEDEDAGERRRDRR